MTVRVAVPSRRALRDDVVALLRPRRVRDLGVQRDRSPSPADSLEFIDMRPGTPPPGWLLGRSRGVHLNRHRARRGLGPPAALPLGTTARPVVASRDDDGRQGVENLEAAVVATLMPKPRRTGSAPVGSPSRSSPWAALWRVFAPPAWPTPSSTYGRRGPV